MVSFEAPGPSPTTTAVVFFETLLGDLPPWALMTASASSRVKPASVPVTTTACPASVWGASGASGPSKLTPDSRSFSMIAWFSGRRTTRARWWR